MRRWGIIRRSRVTGGVHSGAISCPSLFLYALFHDSWLPWCELLWSTMLIPLSWTELSKIVIQKKSFLLFCFCLFGYSYTKVRRDRQTETEIWRVVRSLLTQTRKNNAEKHFFWGSKKETEMVVLVTKILRSGIWFSLDMWRVLTWKSTWTYSMWLGCQTLVSYMVMV
jgi:hypothetical protein